MVAFMAAATPVAAQETGAWEWTIAPYFLVPHLNGEAAIKGNHVDVDAGPGDLFGPGRLRSRVAPSMSA